MIKTKKQLKFYIAADCMMNRGCFACSLKQKLLRLVRPDYIMSYLMSLRKTEYYINVGKKRSIGYLINKYRFFVLGVKLGFSISPNVFGYGLVIPHHGTIVVGSGNKIGNYSVLHTSTCITSGEKLIGDGLYLSTGAKIINDITLGDSVTVAANAVVNKSFDSSNCLLCGVPAIYKKEQSSWYTEEKYQNRVDKVKEYSIKEGI